MKVGNVLDWTLRDRMHAVPALALSLALVIASAGVGSAQEAGEAPTEGQPVTEVQSVLQEAPAEEIAEPAGLGQPETPVQPANTELDAAEQVPNEGTPDMAEEPSTASETSVAESALPAIEHGLEGHDLSPWGMFMMADYVVKSVMIGLTAAALATWVIWLGKWMQLVGARKRARRALRAVTRAASLPEAMSILERRKGVGVLLVRAADEEMAASSDLVGRVSPGGIKERVTSRLSRIEAAAGRKISQGTGLLASIGSVSPFVGLFGTVWGIMNSFIGIAESQTTNLAVVAPGIAEALLATALGLVAAIPAVIIYNAFARSITGYRQLLADVSAGVERLVSRDLDRHSLPQPPVAQAQAAE